MLLGVQIDKFERKYFSKICEFLKNAWKCKSGTRPSKIEKGR